MWDFPQYTSGKRAFSFSQSASAIMAAGSGAGTGVRAGMGPGTGAGTGARTGMGARASRTALKILCKSSSEYLGILIAATEASATGGFAPKGPAGWSDNLSPDLGGGEELKKAIEGATKGATEGRSWRGRPRPRTEVILELISSKTLFQTGWLICWVWRN